MLIKSRNAAQYQDLLFILLSEYLAKRMRQIILSGFLAILLSGNLAQVLVAQRPALFDSPDRSYRKGVDLFDKQKYAAAQQQFFRAVEAYGNLRTELRSDAQYYIALCAIRLFNDDAGALVHEYIRENPESPKVNRIRLQMALYEYQRKQYRSAVDWFESVDRSRLTKDELPEYFFKKGYSYYRRGDNERASLAFYEIKDRDTEYTSPAIYYYAHIAYEDRHYVTALKEFERLRDDGSFGGIVPYYILQIYYLQEDYDRIISTGPGLMSNVAPQREDEVIKLVGDAFFRKGQYDKALPYISKYIEKAKVVTEENRYQAGFTFYRNGMWEEAAEQFEKIAGRKNALGQNAAYHLADCYLKMGNKNKARMAFSSAARIDFESRVQEDAMFNEAKLTYELAYSPFNEAIRLFNEYISKYPGSERIDEAYNYLVMAFLNTKNYKAALASLNKILVKNDRIREACQRVAFYRGLELFRNQEYDQAIDHFDLSLEHGRYNQALRARATYWKAESLVNYGDPGGAVSYYNAFLGSPGAFDLEEYALAHYNLGYIYFDRKEYVQASSWFRKFAGLKRSLRKDLLSDVYNRIGDGYFMQSDYATALNYYEQSLALGLTDPDYAMFQKGFTVGLMKDHEQKIRILDEMIKKFPRSNYCDDAWFETGKSYVILLQPDRALQAYKQILDNYSRSSYVPRAMVQMGLVHYSENRNDVAIGLFKKVVETCPGTPDARSALTGLKNIYVDQNDVDTYFAYARSAGEFADVTTSERDSLTYLSGENLYMLGNCERAVQVLSGYLKEFPQGSFTTNAWFYMAECHARLGQVQDALSAYVELVDRPRNIFTEPALLAAASLSYTEKNYFDALEYYLILEQVAEVPANRLEAITGQMRSHHYLRNYDRLTETGQRLLQVGKIPAELASETHYKMARAYYHLENFPKSLEHYQIVAAEVSSLQGAEAKYRAAEIHYRMGQLDKAEAEIFSMIDMNTPHAYWMAKSFLLLADVLISKKDYFQARYTLQSLLDGYDRRGDGILEEANEKLIQVINRDMFITPEDTLRPVNHFRNP